jgi:hypothetical protein
LNILLRAYGESPNDDWSFIIVLLSLSAHRAVPLTPHIFFRKNVFN